MGRLVQGTLPGLDQNPVEFNQAEVDAEPHRVAEQAESLTGITVALM